MAAIETILGNVTNPGGTLTKVTMAAGNSNVVRSFNDPFKAHLITFSALVQTAGRARLRSPLMHDPTQGINIPVAAGIPSPLMPVGDGVDQILSSQDEITMELSGGGSSKIEELLAWLYYENLPGVNANLISNAILKARAKHTVGVPIAITAGATGGWSGQVAITVSADVLKANHEYALLGAICSTSGVAAVRVQGSDIGGLGVAIPTPYNDYNKSIRWFPYLSKKTGVPMIPVFNGANKGGILIDVAANDTGTTTVISLIMEELTPA
jgi:hypothetical protein